MSVIQDGNPEMGGQALASPVVIHTRGGGVKSGWMNICDSVTGLSIKVSYKPEWVEIRVLTRNHKICGSGSQLQHKSKCCFTFLFVGY